MKHGILLFGLLLLGLSNTAASMPITYEFTGEVDYIINKRHVLDGLGIAVGSTITGSFRYELVQDEKHGGPYEGSANSKQYSAFSMSLILNDTFHYNAVAVGDYPLLQVWDNDPAVNDLFILAASDTPAWFGENTITRFDTSLGLDFHYMALALRDSTRTAFSSLDVPGSLGLADFTSPEFTIGAETPITSAGYTIKGRLTSLRAAVPEPATALLVLLGIVAIATIRAASEIKAIASLCVRSSAP